MRKRLRKKKHLREFVEFGFEYEVWFREPLTTDEEDLLLYQLADAVATGGSMWERRWTFFALRSEDPTYPRKGRRVLSAREEDRKKVEEIFRRFEKTKAVVIGPLVDANHWEPNGWDLET